MEEGIKGLITEKLDNIISKSVSEEMDICFSGGKYDRIMDFVEKISKEHDLYSWSDTKRIFNALMFCEPPIQENPLLVQLLLAILVILETLETKRIEEIEMNLSKIKEFLYS